MPTIVFSQRLTAIDKATRDAWGDRTYTAMYQNIPCRFVYDTQWLLLSAEEREVVVAVCYVPKKYTLATDDRITFNGEYYLVYEVIPQFDLFGNIHHQKLLLKSR